MQNNGNYVSEDSIIAEEFKLHFSKLADNLDKKIPRHLNDPENYLFESRSNTFCADKCSIDEVKKLINNSKNKSAGINDVPTFIYKLLSNYLSIIIFNWFNQSIAIGYFPSSFKLARVVPIFKGGDNTLIKNYRPICILPFFSKIFERLMHKRLYNYFKDKKILYDRQFGFTKGLSTSDALSEFVDVAYDAYDKGEFFVSVLLDLAKAFDTVNIDLLIRKLKHYGLDKLSLSWLKSYLYSRRYFVKINNTESTMYTLNLGVPQGSVLGPLLFNIYINDMHRCCNKLNFIHFADDSTAFIRSTLGPQQLSDLINVELEKIRVWLACNRLSLNIDKTSYIIFNRKNLDLQLHIEDVPIA